jgi:hypothetical protein
MSANAGIPASVLTPAIALTPATTLGFQENPHSRQEHELGNKACNSKEPTKSRNERNSTDAGNS